MHHRIDSGGATRSLGAGVDCEIYYTLWVTYILEVGLYLATRCDGYSTLRNTWSLSSASLIPSAHLHTLMKLRAICGLMLLAGQPPLPLDPAIIQFLLNDNNVHSLHKDFIGKWHPDLQALLNDWKTAGHESSL